MNVRYVGAVIVRHISLILLPAVDRHHQSCQIGHLEEASLDFCHVVDPMRRMHLPELIDYALQFFRVAFVYHHATVTRDDHAGAAHGQKNVEKNRRDFFQPFFFSHKKMPSTRRSNVAVPRIAIVHSLCDRIYGRLHKAGIRGTPYNSEVTLIDCDTTDTKEFWVGQSAAKQLLLSRALYSLATRTAATDAAAWKAHSRICISMIEHTAIWFCFHSALDFGACATDGFREFRLGSPCVLYATHKDLLCDLDETMIDFFLATYEAHKRRYFEVFLMCEEESCGDEQTDDDDESGVTQTIVAGRKRARPQSPFDISPYIGDLLSAKF